MLSTFLVADLPPELLDLLCPQEGVGLQALVDLLQPLL